MEADSTITAAMVRRVSRKASFRTFEIARKQRFGDRQAKNMLAAYNHQHRHTILMDDVISSGNIMTTIAVALRAAATPHAAHSAPS